jgi:hypothetical protein
VKRIAILQPGYLPWLGFFDLMYRCDVFVVLDDVQYTARDWRNRNRIKTPNGALWLTVPVMAKGARQQMIKDVKVDNTQLWQKRHLKSFESFYRKASYYEEIMELVDNVYRKTFTYLIDIDMENIFKICDYLSLRRDILLSSGISSYGEKDTKLMSICRSLKADSYISGNAAKAYLREDIFMSSAVTVEWHDYVHPFYKQMWLKKQGFISHLSIIDLLFNHGPDSLPILSGQKIVQIPSGMKVSHADGSLSV